MPDSDSSTKATGKLNSPLGSVMAGFRAGVYLDVRHALRQFWKSKGFALTSLTTLAFCIGTTTAIFSMVYALMLKPLPFNEPGQIVEIYNKAVKAGLDKMPSNVVQYVDYSANATSYESVGLWNLMQGMFGEEGAVERMSGARATAEMFDILRVKPLLGQFFTKEQSQPGADDVVVLMQSFWESQFAEDPAIVGKTIRFNGNALKIIGVAPRILEAFDARVKFIQPLSWSPEQADPQRRYSLGIQFFGRLKPDVAVGQAAAEAALLERRYYDAAPPPTRAFIERSGITMTVGGVQDERVEPVKSTLYLLQGGVAFVLLIGCVNVANLLLVRSNARQSELGIRFALGASRAVIARQLLVESLLLTGMGAVLGVGLAWGALRVINRYTIDMLPQALPMQLDGRVLGFAVGLTILVGLFIGLIPVIHLLRTNLSELIQRSSRGASAGRGVRSLSSILVVAQVAVALVLLTGAGLLIQSFANALKVNPGLDPANVVIGRIAIPAVHRASDEAASGLQERLLQSMREIPGVSSVALSFSTPFQGGLPVNALTLENDPSPPGAPQPGAYRVIVSPGYFDTMHLTLVEGRFYAEADREAGQRHFVVDEAFAQKFFPGKSAIGGRFNFGRRPEKAEDWPTIIGVVRNVPHNGVEDHSGIPFIYQLMQGRPGGLTLFVRSTRTPADMFAVIRAKLQEIDPAIPLFDTTTLADSVSGSFDSRRAVMLLLATFAGLALFLSALGIYGVLAYDVSQRTREIGIRGAIGASRGQLIGMILKQGLFKSGLGLCLGLVGAWLLSRYMTSLLFEVRPTEPLVYAVVALLLLLVAALASYLPALRAAKINPLDALRIE